MTRIVISWSTKVSPRELMRQTQRKLLNTMQRMAGQIGKTAMRSMKNIDKGGRYTKTGKLRKGFGEASPPGTPPYVHNSNGGDITKGGLRPLVRSGAEDRGGEIVAFAGMVAGREKLGDLHEFGGTHQVANRRRRERMGDVSPVILSPEAKARATEGVRNSAEALRKRRLGIAHTARKLGSPEGLGLRASRDGKDVQRKIMADRAWRKRLLAESKALRRREHGKDYIKQAVDFHGQVRDVIYRKNRTGRQAEQARRDGEILNGPPYYTGNYPDRPIIRPAAAKIVPRFKELVADDLAAIIQAF